MSSLRTAALRDDQPDREVEPLGLEVLGGLTEPLP